MSASPPPNLLRQPSALRDFARIERAGLISDVDGTISPIAPTPAEARVLPGCQRALRQLVDLLAVVALATGRPAREAAAMARVPGAVIFGNHGLERMIGERVEVAPMAEDYRKAVAEALRAALAQLPLPGVRGEPKELTAAIHYRLARDPEGARAAVLRVATEEARSRGLMVHEGKRVVELCPPLSLDKGTAVRRITSEYALDAVLYLGDDLTDINAFQATADLRRSGLVGVTVVVLGAETPPEAMRAADFSLDSVAETARALLLLARLRTRS